MLAAPAILRAAPASLTFPNSGGALQDAYRAAYMQTYTAKTGIEVLGAPYMDVAQVKAMVDSGAVNVDMCNLDATEAAVLAAAGLLEPIDYGIVDRNKLMPGAAGEHVVLVDFAALVIAWNTRSVPAGKAPKSWQQFFDTKAFPGQRSLWKAASQTLEVAAMGGGQSRDSLYPIDTDRAFKSLGAVRSDLTWWESGAQGAQLVLSGTVDFGAVWNGRVFKPKLEGAPVDYTFDGALLTPDAMVVPKGAKNKKQAMEFIANMIDAANQATFAKIIPYGPVNPAAFPLLTEEERARLPNAPAYKDKTVMQDSAYWAANGAKLIERFNKWLVT
ncbi:MAG: extracellular solute-binding protein [Rhodospirillales bacterium]|nr:extracellular solute-binding protein [Rhodospirillales bacterium]